MIFELCFINLGNSEENVLFIGKDELIGINGVVFNFWEEVLLVCNELDQILVNVEKILDVGVCFGLIVIGVIFKVLVNGILVQFFEQLFLVNVENVVFSFCEVVLEDVIVVLEVVCSIVNVVLVFVVFLDKIFVSIDVINIINVLLVCYYNMFGNYDVVIEVVNWVDLFFMFIFVYDVVNINFIVFVFILINNVYQLVDFIFGLFDGLVLDVGDQCLLFYFQNLIFDNNDFCVVVFWDVLDKVILVYLFGEMAFICVEVFVCKGMVGEVIDVLNEVLIKQFIEDVFGVGVGFNVYIGVEMQEVVFDVIYVNWCIELMMFGLCLEDSCCFGCLVFNIDNEECNCNFYLYLDSEWANNINILEDFEI